MAVKSKVYKFIIDTDKAAYNFRKSLCLYCTNQVKVNDVYDEKSAINILQIAGNKVVPSMLEPTPGFGCDSKQNIIQLNNQNKSKYPFPSYQSVALFFESRPSEKEINNMRTKALEFLHSHNIGILAFRLVVVTTSVTEKLERNYEKIV